MRILHIEDQVYWTEIVRKTCPEDIVTCAPSLELARSVLRHSAFDLLLIDLNLSDSHGSDTVEALKPYCLPMVVLTGDTSPQYATDCRILGVDDFVLKSQVVKGGFAMRLKTVYEKHLGRWGGKCDLAFADIDALRPYLSTASVFASLALAAG